MIFQVLSWYESSPTVVKEALSCGLPVVTTNVGDVKTIIRDPLLGIIVEEYDKNVFAEFLFKMIEFKIDNQEEIKKACRKKALNNFGFEIIADEFISLYKNLR